MATIVGEVQEQVALGGAAHFDRATFLMCSPEFYDVGYVINPWMAGNLHRPTRDRAFAQWRALFDALHEFADIKLLPARPGSPDMAFVAHAAVVHHGVAALSSFAHRERQGEECSLRAWLRQHGFLVWETPRETFFEGEGDALVDPNLNCVWAAHGPRTSRQSHRHLADAWHAEVRSLKLVDPRFFHLDTCLAPLAGGFLVYFPDAFDSASLGLLEAAYPGSRRIAINEAEATQFGCNLVNVGDRILLPALAPIASGGLSERLKSEGFRVTELPLSEFVHGGGAAKSLVLRLSDVAVTHPPRA